MPLRRRKGWTKGEIGAEREGGKTRRSILSNLK